VEYLNARDFSVEYDDDSRPPKQAGPVEPETLIFIADDESSEGTALLIVGYKTSASIGVYSFNCGANRNYAQTQKPPYPTNEPLQPQTADTCDEQTPCLNVDILPIVSEQSEMYEVCLTFNNKNPFCSKSDDYFEYAVTLNEEEDDDTAMNYHWLLGEKRCQIAACSESVQFAVLDGDGCAESMDVSIVNMDGVDGVECSALPQIRVNGLYQLRHVRMRKVLIVRQQQHRRQQLQQQPPHNNNHKMMAITTKRPTTKKKVATHSIPSRIKEDTFMNLQCLPFCLLFQS